MLLLTRIVLIHRFLSSTKPTVKTQFTSHERNKIISSRLIPGWGKVCCGVSFLPCGNHHPYGGCKVHLVHNSFNLEPVLIMASNIEIERIQMCQKGKLFSFIITLSNGNTYSSHVYGDEGGKYMGGPTIMNVQKAFTSFTNSIEYQLLGACLNS